MNSDFHIPVAIDICDGTEPLFAGADGVVRKALYLVHEIQIVVLGEKPQRPADMRRADIADVTLAVAGDVSQRCDVQPTVAAPDKLVHRDLDQPAVSQPIDRYAATLTLGGADRDQFVRAVIVQIDDAGGAILKIIGQYIRGSNPSAGAIKKHIN